ncbi:MAG: hypothetical protein MJ239_07180 [Bacilli bacterium]|nr:hypothetical protein [Bacilli bacterium]
MEEENNKKDKKTIIKVLMCDFFILDLIITAIFLIKFFEAKQTEKTPYEQCLISLRETLNKRESSDWNRPDSSLSYESNYKDEVHSFSYVKSPYSLLIDGEAYAGSDSQDRIDEAYALYATYDCKDSLEGLISIFESRKDNIQSCSYRSSEEKEGTYSFTLSGVLNEIGSLTYIHVEFDEYMYSKDVKNIMGETVSINWTIK